MYVIDLHTSKEEKLLTPAAFEIFRTQYKLVGPFSSWAEVHGMLYSLPDGKHVVIRVEHTETGQHSDMSVRWRTIHEQI